MPRLLLSFVLAVTAGCSAPAPLANVQPSADASARAVLEAIAQNDRDRLEALAVSEREFRDHVWPALPAARPERNLPFSYVWGDLRQKSEASLERTLAEHAGRRYELLDVTFDRSTDYGAYRVHRAAQLHVRDATGRTATIRLWGSMLDANGGWKVFSYVVDD